MPGSIKKSVGKTGNNDREDVKIVQTRLNVWIAAGRLTRKTPLAVDGLADALVPVIEDFQRTILGFHSPDGTVDKLPGKTMAKLLEDPPDATGALKCQLLAMTNVAQGTVGGIAGDLWNAALVSLIANSPNAKLTRWHVLTLVDFRLSRRVERLWVVNLQDRSVLYHTWVAHGGGGKDAEGHLLDAQGDFPDHFEDGRKFSSLGPYITLNRYSSDLGHLNNQPAVKLIGLQKGVNGRAKERGVVFHGADYVHYKNSSVGNSWGCFATHPDVNPGLTDAIKDGSFVFAYHDTYKAP